MPPCVWGAGSLTFGRRRHDCAGGSCRGGYTEIGRVFPGTEDTFSIGGNVRAIWIESIDLPRNPDGTYRVIKGILFECVAASS